MTINSPTSVPPAKPRGRPRKTLEEREDGNRKKELLSVAARLFRHQGFNATSTRDIAAAAGMRSGSPFYHFKSKGDLLFAVMEEGMRSALAKQVAARQTMQLSEPVLPSPRQQLHALVRQHFEVLLGSDSDFIPVMLYERRAITDEQRYTLTQLQRDYEAVWLPVLEALHTSGQLRCPVKLARLLIFGALNWSVQWFDCQQTESLDSLTDAAITLFINH